MARRQQDPDRVVLAHLTATPMRDRGTDEQGRRYWRIRHRQTRATVKTGWWTREEVEAAVAAELATPSSSRSRPSNPEVARTVGDVLDRWTRAQVERRDGGEIAERSLTNYRHAARCWKHAIGEVLASALTRELVEDTLRAWRSGSMSPRTAKLNADVMADVVRWGARRGLCPAVDLQRLAAAQVDHEERVNCEYTPTRSEADAVLARIPPGRNRALIELLGLTGARVGEVAALTVGSWDRERGELLISGRDRRRQRRGKVRTRRWPILGRLGDLLGELAAGRPADEPLVEGLPVDCSDLARWTLRAACDVEPAIERYTAHGLRRLVALELLDVTDPRTVSELTGHSVTVLLRDYVRPRPERLRDVVGQAQRRRRVLQLARAHEPGTAGGDSDGDD